jgi:hypothetical protein
VSASNFFHDLVSHVSFPVSGHSSADNPRPGAPKVNKVTSETARPMNARRDKRVSKLSPAIEIPLPLYFIDIPVFSCLDFDKEIGSLDRSGYVTLPEKALAYGCGFGVRSSIISYNVR